MTIGAGYFGMDKSGTLSVDLSFTGNFIGDAAAYSAASPSPKAKPDFGKANLSITRDQKVFKEWSLLLRGSGQAATGPLIANEQFALGGINSVRGYFEGDEYGDSGWFGSMELRTPQKESRVGGWSGAWPAWLRGSIFLDAGQKFLVESRPGTVPTRFLLGTGFGLSANVNNHMDVRLTVGWPLRDSANSEAGSPRTYFSLGGQF